MKGAHFKRNADDLFITEIKWFVGTGILQVTSVI